MFEGEQMQRFERTFFRFTRAEEHFLRILHRLVEFLNTREVEPPRFVVCARRRFDSQIQMYATIGRLQQEVTLHIHGLKPVRYHVQTANTVLGCKLRRYFSLILEEQNLVPRASTLTGHTLSLVYHVQYPADVLRYLES